MKSKGLLLVAIFCFAFTQLFSQQRDTTLVYEFPIQKEIAPPVWRITQKAFDEAEKMSADLILIKMNTYGGMLDAADSIRSKILRSDIPVYVYIDNNAASAGALISIACDSIYMAPSANIGAATVVDQEGKVLPDKYQSYMRSLMRSTAETKGRNPLVAEAMVDPSVYVPAISDTGKVLTFTATEALKHGFCTAIASSSEEVLQDAGIDNYKVVSFKETTMDKVIGFLLTPAVSGILIMIVVGGLYFELQSPGVGFPLIASITAAILFFAPHYVEGLAAHWEILIFVAGIILLGVEIFVLPGFGVAGILGIVMIIFSLTLSMMGSLDFNIDPYGPGRFFRALFIVLGASVVSIIISIFLTKRFFNSDRFSAFRLVAVQDSKEGYVGVDTSMNDVVGRIGIAYSVLRPGGKVKIDEEIYDATAVYGFIEKGDQVRVLRFENTQLYVEKVQ